MIGEGGLGEGGGRKGRSGWRCLLRFGRRSTERRKEDVMRGGKGCERQGLIFCGDSFFDSGREKKDERGG